MSASDNWLRFAQAVESRINPLAVAFERIFGSHLGNAAWDDFADLFESPKTSLRWFLNDEQYIIGLCLMAAICAEKELDVQRDYHDDPDGDIAGADYI